MSHDGDTQHNVSGGSMKFTNTQLVQLVNDAIKRQGLIWSDNMHRLGPLFDERAAKELFYYYKNRYGGRYWSLQEVGFVPHGPGFGIEFGSMMDFDKPYASYVAPLREHDEDRERAYCYAVCHCVARIEQQVQEKELASVQQG